MNGLIRIVHDSKKYNLIGPIALFFYPKSTIMIVVGMWTRALLSQCGAHLSYNTRPELVDTVTVRSM